MGGGTEQKAEQGQEVWSHAVAVRPSGCRGLRGAVRLRLWNAVHTALLCIWFYPSCSALSLDVPDSSQVMLHHVAALSCRNMWAAPEPAMPVKEAT